MIAAAFVGALVGAGIYALIRVFLRPKPGLATMLARIDSGHRSMNTHTVTELDVSKEQSRIDSAARRLGDRLEVLAADRGWQFGRTRQDLSLMNRTLGSFLSTKVIFAVLAFLLTPVLWSILLLFGVPLAPAVPAVAALLFAAIGFFLPDLGLRGEAADRRREFRRSVGIFLDLVALNLTGGRGLPEALMTASTISDQWCLIRIRQALANARLLGTTPWAALGILGEEIGLEELRDLSGTLSLAAQDGAKIRQSLAARAATIRRRELADAEGEAGEKSQSMLVAQLVLCTAFLIFLVYPAVAQLQAQ